MNRASPATGWVRNPTKRELGLNPRLASSYPMGWTLNPITGCRNATPQGLCRGGLFPCYAYQLAHGRLKPLYLTNVRHYGLQYGDTDPFYPRFWPGRLAELDTLVSPDTEPEGKGLFMCDMSDMFGIGIPEQWTGDILHVIESRPWDRFYLLTKQAENLPRWSPFQEHCWVGVTATNPAMFINACRWLEGVDASLKYISFEPALSWNVGLPLNRLVNMLMDAGIGWLIIGACTGRSAAIFELCQRYPLLTPMVDDTRWTAQPNIEWLDMLVEACEAVGTAVFLKQNLAPRFREMPFRDRDKYPSLIQPDGLRFILRQEMPIVI